MTTQDQTTYYSDRYDEAVKPVRSLILAGRYSEAVALIRERFCGDDNTVVPERFRFSLDTWLVIWLACPVKTSADFLQDLLNIEPDTQKQMGAIYRTANTHGIRREQFETLAEHVREHLNREVNLYIIPALHSSRRHGQGSEFMKGPLWLVLLLCVCRSNKASTSGALAYKGTFTDDDLAWIDSAAITVAKLGAELGLARTVVWWDDMFGVELGMPPAETWKERLPALQAMVAELEGRARARARL